MKRYRDVLKSSMKASEINPDSWESDALDRPGWRKICHAGMATFEANRLAKLAEKRTRCIKRFNNYPQLDAETFTCAVCSRVRRSRIGLHSHKKNTAKFYCDQSSSVPGRETPSMTAVEECVSGAKDLRFIGRESHK